MTIWKTSCALVVCVMLQGCSAQWDRASTVINADACEQLARLPIAHILVSGRSGSAVPLGDGRFITCRHLLGDTPCVIALDGVATTAKASLEGAGDAFETDWVFFTVDPKPMPPRVPLVVRPIAHVRPGDTLYLVGYWASEHEHVERLTESQARAIKRKAVPATVVNPSPFWIGAPRSLLYASSPHDRVYRGMSGGAAVIWDPLAREWVVIGIYIGFRQGTHVIGRFAASTPNAMHASDSPSAELAGPHTPPQSSPTEWPSLGDPAL